VRASLFGEALAHMSHVAGPTEPYPRTVARSGLALARLERSSPQNSSVCGSACECNRRRLEVGSPRASSVQAKVRRLTVYTPRVRWPCRLLGCYEWADRQPEMRGVAGPSCLSPLDGFTV
jgi:hypothetical protein